MQAWILLDIALTETIYPLRFLSLQTPVLKSKVGKSDKWQGQAPSTSTSTSTQVPKHAASLGDHRVIWTAGNLARCWQEVGKCHNFRAISPTGRTRTHHTVTDRPAGKGCGKMLPGKKWTEGHTSVFTQATREQNSFSWTRHLITRAIKIWWKSQSTIVEEKELSQDRMKEMNQLAVTLESIASVPRECDPFCYLEGLKLGWVRWSINQDDGFGARK